MKTSFKFLMALFIAVSLLACNKENPSGSDTPQPKEYNRQTDSLALVAIYNASDGANWKEGKQWKLNKPLSKEDWPGIQVDDRGRVTSLSFSTTDLFPNNWELPADIGDLKELTFLKVNNAKLIGAIPSSVFGLTKLQKLYFEKNNLSSVFTGNLENLTELTDFYIDSNTNLEGSVPAQIGNLKNLKQVSIAYTKMSGAIPAELNNCTNLASFSANHTTVTIDNVDWTKFSNLTSLMLNNNEALTGPLPDLPTTLTNIQLQDCNFTGNVPESWANINAKCGTLMINGNKLKGVLPADFVKHSKYGTSKWVMNPQQEGYGLTDPTQNPPPWSDDLN